MMHFMIIVASLFCSLAAGKVLDEGPSETVSLVAQPTPSTRAFPLVGRDTAGFAFNERSFYLYFCISKHN